MKTDLGFADLNIPQHPLDTLKKRILRAFELGYHTVAVNTIVNQEDIKVGKKRKLEEEGAMIDYPEPTCIKLNKSEYVNLVQQDIEPTILTRLTIVIDNNDFMVVYNKSKHVKNYDLLSIVPKTQQTLQSLLKSTAFSFDILSCDVENLDNFRWNRKLYREVLDKNSCFELQYGPMIANRKSRKRMIQLAQYYNFAGKSKGVIYSSGCKNMMQLRPPIDVANLCFILGMNEAEGNAAIYKNVLDVHKAALGRKMGVFRVRIEKVDTNTNNKEDSDSSDATDSEMAVE